MIKPHLTVSTDTARPYKPTVNQDAQEIADGITRQVGQAARQAVMDAASLADAKLRRSLEGQYPAAVLDALAGPALTELASRSAAEDPKVTVNSARAHLLAADVRDLPQE